MVSKDRGGRKEVNQRENRLATRQWKEKTGLHKEGVRDAASNVVLAWSE